MESCSQLYEDGLRRKAPPPGGREAGRLSRWLFLFLLFEGKRKLDGPILDGDAQHQLLRILATFEPDGAGNLVVGPDGCIFEVQGLLRCLVESLFPLLVAESTLAGRPGSEFLMYIAATYPILPSAVSIWTV